MKGDPPPPPVILFFVLLCLATTDPLLTISLVAWLGKEVVRLGTLFTFWERIFISGLNGYVEFCLVQNII